MTHATATLLESHPERPGAGHLLDSGVIGRNHREVQMTRAALQLVLAVVLVIIGWSAGQAQGKALYFDLSIDAPVGETTIRCTRGCEFFVLKQGQPTASSQFTLACQGDAGPKGCSGGVAGALVPPTED